MTRERKRLDPFEGSTDETANVLAPAVVKKIESQPENKMKQGWEKNHDVYYFKTSKGLERKAK